MSNVRTRDYDGPRSLDPACAPDEVDMVKACECLTCGHEWIDARTHADVICLKCGESDMDGLRVVEVPA